MWMSHPLLESKEQQQSNEDQKQNTKIIHELIKSDMLHSHKILVKFNCKTRMSELFF